MAHKHGGVYRDPRTGRFLSGKKAHRRGIKGEKKSRK